jgi:hypothetical protein
VVASSTGDGPDIGNGAGGSLRQLRREEGSLWEYAKECVMMHSRKGVAEINEDILR